MAEIVLRDVQKSYTKDVRVIHGVNVTIADGEFIVIVGPSGCGKSTLLRMIAGLETITEGEIAIGGRVVNDVEPKDRNIAMVFQNYALYPHMTVYENMSYGLRIRRLPPADDQRARAARGEDPRAGAVPRRGSRASSPAASASAWPWDAPSCASPPRSSSTSRSPTSTRSCACRCASRSRSCTGELRTTSIYVTHDQVEAMTLADRMIVMNAGVVEQVGAPIDVYDDPESQFVAGFIGSPAMNFLPGKRVGDEVDVGGGVQIAASRGVARLRARGDHGGRASRAPRCDGCGGHVRVHGGHRRGARRGFARCTACFAGAPLVARVSGHAAPLVGQALALAPKPGRIHFFDGATGKRLRPARP